MGAPPTATPPRSARTVGTCDRSEGDLQLRTPVEFFYMSAEGFEGSRGNYLNRHLNSFWARHLLGRRRRWFWRKRTQPLGECIRGKSACLFKGGGT